MDVRDPFASIGERCPISSSQNERLRHCRLAGVLEEDQRDTDTQDSGEIDEEISGILIVTPSDSSDKEENNYGNEIFQTPPENSQFASSNDGGDDRTVVVEEEETEREGEKAVDLGADTDLRFSEVELSQSSINEVMQSELNKVRVLKRELAASERLIESLKKKSKDSDDSHRSESLNGCLGENVNKTVKFVENWNSNEDNPNKTIFGESSKHYPPKRCLVENVEKIMKSLGKLNSKKNCPYNCGGKSLQSHQNSAATEKGLRFTEDLEHSRRNGEGDRSGYKNGNGEGTPNLSQISVQGIDSEANRDRSSKRNLELSTPNLELETEAADKGLRCSEDLEHGNGEGDGSECENGNGEGTSNLGQKSIDDIDKHRYTGPSVSKSSEMGRRTRKIRALPVSICGPRVDKDMRNNCRKIKLLDVLRMLSRNRNDDTSPEGKSFLDVAKSCGITFP